MKLLKSLILVFLFSSSAYGQDTLLLAKHRLGINAGVELIRGSKIGRIGTKTNLGVWYEKRVMRSLVMTADVGLNYRKIGDVSKSIYGGRLNDSTSILDEYNFEKRYFSAFASFGYKFYYSKSPKIYFILGVGMQRIFGKPIARNYIKSFYRVDSEIGDEFIKEGDEKPEPIFIEDFAFELIGGLGIGLGKWNIELTGHLDTAYNYGNPIINYGLRFRREFISFEGKKKEEDLIGTQILVD